MTEHKLGQFRQKNTVCQKVQIQTKNTIFLCLHKVVNFARYLSYLEVLYSAKAERHNIKMSIAKFSTANDPHLLSYFKIF